MEIFDLIYVSPLYFAIVGGMVSSHRNAWLCTLIGLTPQKGNPCTALSIKMLNGAKYIYGPWLEK